MTRASDVPRVGVGAVVLQDGNVLLIRRRNPPFAGHWSLPGGRQDWGETVAEAARREVAEETGLDVEIGPIIAVIDLIQPPPPAPIAYHYTLIDFLARCRGGTLRAASDATEACWVPLADLPAYGLWDKTAEVIAKAVAVRTGGAGALTGGG